MESRSVFPAFDIPISEQAMRIAVRLMPHELEGEKLLGEGNFGKVSTYKYVGQNERLVKFLAGDRIVIKTFKPADERGSLADIEQIQNEIDVCAQLYVSAERENNDDPQHLMALPLVDENGRVCGLVSRYITCDIRRQQSKTVNEYVRDLAFAYINNKRKDPDARSDIGVFVVQLIASMVQSLMTLHKKRLIAHLDIASRNFLVGQPNIKNGTDVISLSAIAIDFGLSRKISKIDDVFIYPHQQCAPIRHLSPDLIKSENKETSVLDDWYALKCSILELIAAALSDDDEHIRTAEDVLYFKVGENINQHGQEKLRSEINNVKSLKLFYANTFTLINTCDDSRKDALHEVLNAYANFITAEMGDGLPVSNRIELQYTLFLTANEKYARAVFQSGINRVKERKKYIDTYNLLHDIQGLLQLPFTEAFMKSELYGTLKRLTTRVEVHKYVDELEIQLTGDKKESRHSSAYDVYMSDSSQDKKPKVAEAVFADLSGTVSRTQKAKKEEDKSHKPSLKRRFTRTITGLFNKPEVAAESSSSTSTNTGNVSPRTALARAMFAATPPSPRKQSPQIGYSSLRIEQESSSSSSGQDEKKELRPANK